MSQNSELHLNRYILERNNLNLSLEKIALKEGSSNLKTRDILLIHGLTFSSHQFDVDYQDYSLARYLAKQGYRVWLLDITGYGQSSKPKDGFSVNGDYASEDISFAIEFIKKSEAVSKVHLFGWSFGTISSSLAAIKNQNSIQSLVLYAPIPYGLDFPLPSLDYQGFDLDSTTDDFQKIIGSNLINPEKTDLNMFHLYQKNCVQFDGKGSPNGCRKDLFQPKTVQLINPEKLIQPVFVIAGTQDPYIHIEKDIVPFVKKLPNPKSEMCKVEGSSHIMMLEKPYYQKFQCEISQFLKSTD